MTLTKPTPGDLYDRLCVLELKLQNAVEKQIPCEHFDQEREEILTALSQLPPADQDARFDLASFTLQLAIITKRLWDLTDEQQAANEGTVGDMKKNSQLLIGLREANRERYRLRRLIDEAYHSYRGLEKV